jgi:glutaminyl-peptide cyclotransferase
VATLQALHGWSVQLDEFTAATPHGPKLMTNVIATCAGPTAAASAGPSSERVVVAAHYDSKYFAPGEGEFIGATDSAVPCAMLLLFAEAIAAQQWAPTSTLVLVFFDGEEAYEAWTQTDSTYGARTLPVTVCHCRFASESLCLRKSVYLCVRFSHATLGENREPSLG